jgi:hypothetical protein
MLHVFELMRLASDLPNYHGTTLTHSLSAVTIYANHPHAVIFPAFYVLLCLLSLWLFGSNHLHCSGWSQLQAAYTGKAPSKRVCRYLFNVCSDSFKFDRCLVATRVHANANPPRHTLSFYYVWWVISTSWWNLHTATHSINRYSHVHSWHISSDDTSGLSWISIWLAST